MGPQDGTLLVTWDPVTNQPRPPSRAAVAGYLIYADGKRIMELGSPTGDHVVLRLSDFVDDPPLFITVRTKTKEGATSADSNVVRVPRSLHVGAIGPPKGRLARYLASTATTLPSQVVSSYDKHGIQYFSSVSMDFIRFQQSLQSRGTTAGTAWPPSGTTVTTTVASQMSPSILSTSGGLLMIQPSGASQYAGTSQLPPPIPPHANIGANPQVAISPFPSLCLPSLVPLSLFALLQFHLNIRVTLMDRL